MALPTFQEMWARYLFGSTTAPHGDQLLDENLIRAPGVTSKIQISAVDFMAKGAPGGFVNPANFLVIQRFFNDTDKNLNTELLKKAINEANKNGVEGYFGEIKANGEIELSLKAVVSLSRALTENAKDIVDDAINKFSAKEEKARVSVSISQSSFHPDGESNYDFAKRVQLFETTAFQIGTAGKGQYDNSIRFIVHADGSRKITNMVISPSLQTTDNFDFIGGNGNSLEGMGNEIGRFITDPSSIYDKENNDIVRSQYDNEKYEEDKAKSGKEGLGRTVEFEYTDIDELARVENYTIENYRADKAELVKNNFSDGFWTKLGRLYGMVSYGTLQMFKEMYEQDIISFQDDQGRTVYYDTNTDKSSKNDLIRIIRLDLVKNNLSLATRASDVGETGVLMGADNFSVPSGTYGSLIDIEEDRNDNIQKTEENR